MPPQRNVAAPFAKALADPVRIGILTALRDGPRSASALATRLGTTPHTVARHGRELCELGFVRRRGRPAVYELIQGADFPDEIWEQLPTPVKQAAVAATLAQIQATTASAVIDGGFDRRDMHLTRTTLKLDDDEFKRVSREMLDFRSQLHAAHERAANRLAQRGHDSVPAEVVLMLFAAPGAALETTHPADLAAFGPEEGRERAYRLYESIDELLVQPRVDWRAILDVLDELRVVVRAATRAQDARQQDPTRSPRS